MLTRPNALGPPRNCLALALTTMAFLALAAPGMSVASPAPVVTFKTVKVGAPGNPRWESFRSLTPSMRRAPTRLRPSLPASRSAESSTAMASALQRR